MPVETILEPILEETLEIKTETLTDPFGENNLSTPSHIIQENNVVVPKQKKVKSPKFIISGELKKRLKKLIAESDNENAKNVATSILELKNEPESGYNYLGLSNSDYSKISYLDNARIEKFKDITKEELVIDNNSKIYNIWTSWNGSTHTQEIKTYSKNVKRPFVLAPLKEALGEDLHPNFKAELEGTRDKLKDGIIQPFIEVNGEKIYSIHAYVAKFDPTYYSQMVNDFDYGRSHNPIGYDSRKITFSFSSYQLENKKYCKISPNFYYSTNGYYVKPSVIQISKLWDSNVRYHTKVGKIVRKIFPNIFNDIEITDFSEEYRKLIVVNKAGGSYLEVSGEEIAEAYLDENAKTSGSLGNSCMRYSRCQSYFKIYTENSFCKLGILKSRDKIAARALLWEVEGTIYYDRIYYCDNDSNYLLEGIFQAKGYTKIYGSDRSIEISISKEVFDSYEKYPYLDTLCYYDLCNEVLTNYEPENYYSMRRTDGWLNNHYNETCAECGDRVSEDDYATITMGDHCGEIVCNHCGTWTVNDEYILSNDLIETYEGEYYHIEDVVELFNGEYAYKHDDDLQSYENNRGYFIRSHHEYVKIEGLYYHPEDSEAEELLEKQENEEQTN